jgi:hypothetical protein
MSERPGDLVPPPPWRLRGRVTIVPALARLADAQAWVGSAGRVVPVAPGRTLGGALLASYETGSTLPYRELLVASALVRRGPMLGLWADHVWVDSANSLAGGRQIWGIPKRRARFSELERGAVEVQTDDGRRRATQVAHWDAPRARPPATARGALRDARLRASLVPRPGGRAARHSADAASHPQRKRAGRAQTRVAILRADRARGR